ncbi:MAG: HEPN domain-containing protein [Bacteroidales bacterium]|nr:HEPN domain-containing protein [Bacteroidales bacterium]
MKYSMDEKSISALSEFRLQRAKQTLHEAMDIASRGHHIAAVNRLYYACFYAVNGLLIKNKIIVRTHTGVKQMFGLHFVKTGKLDPVFGRFYSRLFNDRISGDYDDFVSFDKEMVEELIPQAEEFICQIKELIQK